MHLHNHPPLTPREDEVFLLLISGKTHKEIAEILFISPHTAREHIFRIYTKLNVHSRSQLIDYAIASGLLTLVYKGQVITGKSSES